MKQSSFLRMTVRKFTFKTTCLRDRSAHFSIKDYFECMSPHELAA